MPSDVLIKGLRIEAFRGFRDRQEFGLDASAIIVSGPNGTGKTSFFDAIQWCLVGSLERLASLRAKRTVEHIVNQYRLNERASVELDLVVGSQRVTVRRVGDHAGSSLELQSSNGAHLFGTEAATMLEAMLIPDGGPDLELALSTTGLMQQDAMRAMLQAKPADRYRHVSTVLGLGELEEFEDGTKQAAKDAAESFEAAARELNQAAASLKTAEERLEQVSERQSRRPSIEAVRDEIVGLLSNLPPGLVGPSLPEQVKAEDLADLASGAGQAMARVSEVAAALRRLSGTADELDPEPTDDEVASASAAAARAKQAVEAAASAVPFAQSKLDAVERTASEVSRLAAAAIPQLSHLCPVCGQEIDSEEVEAALRLRAGDTASVLATRSELEEAELRHRDAISEQSTALLSEQGLVQIRAVWDLQRDGEKELEGSIADLSDPVGGFRISTDGAERLPDRLPLITQALAEVRSRVLSILDIVGDSAISAELARLKSEVESFSEALLARRQRADQQAHRSARIKALSEATVQARVEVTEARFNAVQPLVADIFSRLDPHPAFKSIEFELNTYYKKGTTTPLVRDVVEEVSADPLVIFSTSQANIAALSYFLAMGWSAGDRSLPFVLLDDPVQSMDDVNVLGFADLTRYIRSTRQLMISTHERRFAGLLERKLAPRSADESTIILEFAGWDRSGPAVTSRRVEPQLLDRPIRIVGAA